MIIQPKLEHQLYNLRDVFYDDGYEQLCNSMLQAALLKTLHYIWLVQQVSASTNLLPKF